MKVYTTHCTGLDFKGRGVLLPFFHLVSICLNHWLAELAEPSEN